MPVLRGILILALMTLAGCTRYELSKPGVTEEAFTKDRNECTEMAQYEAFRDPRLGFRHITRLSLDFDDRTTHSPEVQHISRGELRYRYYKVCMQARGYKLTPVPEE